MLTTAATLLALMAGQIPPPNQEAESVQKLRQDRLELLGREAAALEQAAVRLDATGDGRSATAVRSLIVVESAGDGPLVFHPLSEVDGVTDGGLASRPSTGLPSDVVDLRREDAEQLFRMASRAADSEVANFGLASQILSDVVERNPGHVEARRLLGFIRHGDGWATPQAAKNLSDGLILDAEFGWVPRDWVDHLRQGELPGIIIKGRPVPWLPAAEADALRADILRQPWQIRTEHFEVRTNVSLAEAVAFGRRLEALHDVFFWLMADAIGPENLPLAKRFRQPELWATASVKRHEVWYFARQDEYTRYAREHFQRDESESLGFYLDPQEARRFHQPPRSFFYRDLNQELTALATLFHEASHQLLFETAGPSGYGRNVGQFWVWEGLGTYFETFTPMPDGNYQIGGVVGPRMEKARRDLAPGGPALPVVDFTSMGRVRFNNEQGVYTNYAEAMALAVFLIHHDGGHYRDGFFDYVRDAYRGRFSASGGARSLSDRVGVPWERLDAELRAYVAANPAVGRSPDQAAAEPGSVQREP